MFLVKCRVSFTTQLPGNSFGSPQRIHRAIKNCEQLQHTPIADNKPGSLNQGCLDQNDKFSPVTKTSFWSRLLDPQVVFVKKTLHNHSRMNITKSEFSLQGTSAALQWCVERQSK